MAEDTALQNQMQRIGEMVGQLEADADPNARALAKELLESLMAFHGAALERILEIASEAGEAGETIIRKCGRDELVSSALLLYGLHPGGFAFARESAPWRSRGPTLSRMRRESGTGLHQRGCGGYAAAASEAQRLRLDCSVGEIQLLKQPS